MLLPIFASAQAPAKTASAGSSGWTKRTPDGQPDLQGVWTNPTITPFERPVELGNKAFLTEQEAEEMERRAKANQVDKPPPPGQVGAYEQIWLDPGKKVVGSRRTSLVIDPPDGRVPLTAWAAEKRNYAAAHENDDYVNLTPWDRCVTRGSPAGMFPAGYNNAYQIVQTPGYVTIHYEMIHNVRIIPLDGRPHLPASVRLWDGDPRGHWEGNTLVVDSTNYNDKGSIATSAATGRIRNVAQSEALHVVERFTRINAGTIEYEVKIEDPKVYTKSWTVALPLSRDDNYQIYEYACHEANHLIVNILGAARAAEKAKK